MRATTFALAIVAVLTVAGSSRADDATNREDVQKIMFAAAVILSDASQHFGDLVIDTPERAHFADGSAFFFRKSDCKYSQYFPEKQPFKWFEVIDFRAITENHHVTESLGSHSLLFDGDSPNTRCFMFEGQRGWCVPTIRLTVGPEEQKRILNNLQFIKKSCTKAEPQPY